jgi:threonine dehydrogenase-like Zn-dependent dehydrogenase
MRQLSYHGNRRLCVEDVAPAELGPGELRVRVHSVGLCTSDVYGYSGLNDRRDAVISPGQLLVMGHEASGTVDELGPGVVDPALGTRVAVNPIYGCGHCARCRSGAENLCDTRTVLGCSVDAPGGYAETMVVPAANVVTLGEGTSFELGALVEPLTVGAHGVRLASLQRSSSVLVIGGGIIGLGAALAARRWTDGEVLVIEPQEQRRRLCAHLGLSAAAPEDLVGGQRAFDVALDCVSRPETFARAIAAVGAGGLVVMIGIWEDVIPLPVSAVVWSETRIVGSYGYTQADFADVAAWVDRREVDLETVIERRVGFDGVIEAFEAYAAGSLKAVRTLLQPAL